jgi:WD40 repeat protein
VDTGEKLWSNKNSKTTPILSSNGIVAVPAYSTDQFSELIDLQSGKELGKIQTATSKFASLQYSPLGDFIFAVEISSDDGSSNEKLHIIKADTGERVIKIGFVLLASLDKEGKKNLVKFSPDGRYAVLPSGYNQILWDIQNKKPLYTLSGINKFSSVISNNFMIVQKAFTNKLQVLRLSDLSLIYEINTGVELSYSTKILISPDERRFTIGTPVDKGTIKIQNRDLSNGQLISEQTVNSSSNGSFPKSGLYFCSSSELFKTGMDSALKTFITSTKLPVTTCEWGKDEKSFMFVSSDYSWKNKPSDFVFEQYDSLALKSKSKFILPAGKVFLTSYEFSSDLSKLITLTNEKVQLWSLAGNKKLLELSQDSITYDASFDPGGKYFATASADGFVRVYKLQNGELLYSVGSQ